MRCQICQKDARKDVDDAVSKLESRGFGGDSLGKVMWGRFSEASPRGEISGEI